MSRPTIKKRGGVSGDGMESESGHLERGWTVDGQTRASQWKHGGDKNDGDE